MRTHARLGSLIILLVSLVASAQALNPGGGGSSSGGITLTGSAAANRVSLCADAGCNLTSSANLTFSSNHLLIGAPTDDTSSLLQVNGDIRLTNGGLLRFNALSGYLGVAEGEFKITNLGKLNVNNDVGSYGAFADAHFNRNMLGVHIPNHSYSSPGIEFGAATASSNSVTVTFAAAFNNAVPVFCICTPIDAGGTHTCTMNAAPSNTAVTFKTSGATDVIHYACMGRE